MSETVLEMAPATPANCDQTHCRCERVSETGGGVEQAGGRREGTYSDHIACEALGTRGGRHQPQVTERYSDGTTHGVTQ
jgi:hypothetical protein